MDILGLTTVLWQKEHCRSGNSVMERLTAEYGNGGYGYGDILGLTTVLWQKEQCRSGNSVMVILRLTAEYGYGYGYGDILGFAIVLWQKEQCRSGNSVYGNLKVDSRVRVRVRGYFRICHSVMKIYLQFFFAVHLIAMQSFYKFEFDFVSICTPKAYFIFPWPCCHS